MSEKKAANGHHDGSSSRAFTEEQKAAVIRVRKCSPTAFYDILGLESVRSSCSDSDIKKAYRKLSLLTHPDKNGYKGADEAFKMVSRAFQVLSDEDKKKKFDRFGGDPESRFGGGGGGGAASGASPFSGFAQQRGGRGPMFEEEISPEELFRQFFGGGLGGGGPFGGGPFGFAGGPGFAFNMGGGPGIRIHNFGGPNPRRRPHNHDANGQQQQQSFGSALQSLLPLLLLFILPLLSGLFSGDSSPKGPSMRFDAAHSPYTEQHTSNRLNINYWVNPSEVRDYNAAKWRDLDKFAESRYLGMLNDECLWEQNRKAKLVEEARGFLFNDQVKLDQARNMQMPNCKKLSDLGYRVS